MNPELTARIQAAIASTPEFTSERNKALKQIKWVLKVADVSNDVYACLDGLSVGLTYDIKKAIVFDGRDNEAMKQSWYQGLLNERLDIVLL